MEYVEGLTGKNEKIIIKTRKHWIALIGSVFTNLVFAFVIVALVLLLDSSKTPRADTFSLLLVFPFGLLIRDYCRWWNEQYLVTNRRVIQAEGIFNKRVIDSSLEKVNDVVLTQSIVGRMMNYGDIEILTASEIGVNDLRMIRDPVRFKTEMINQKETLGVDDHYRGATAMSKNDIPSILSVLDELRKKGILTEEEFQEKKKHLLAKM